MDCNDEHLPGTSARLGLVLSCRTRTKWQGSIRHWHAASALPFTGGPRRAAQTGGTYYGRAGRPLCTIKIIVARERCSLKSRDITFRSRKVDLALVNLNSFYRTRAATFCRAAANEAGGHRPPGGGSRL